MLTLRPVRSISRQMTPSAKKTLVHSLDLARILLKTLISAGLGDDPNEKVLRKHGARRRSSIVMATGNSGPGKVEIRKENGQFRLYRGGQPYFVKGSFGGRRPNLRNCD